MKGHPHQQNRKALERMQRDMDAKNKEKKREDDNRVRREDLHQQKH